MFMIHWVDIQEQSIIETNNNYVAFQWLNSNFNPYLYQVQMIVLIWFLLHFTGSLKHYFLFILVIPASNTLTFFLLGDTVVLIFLSLFCRSKAFFQRIVFSSESNKNIAASNNNLAAVTFDNLCRFLVTSYISFCHFCLDNFLFSIESLGHCECPLFSFFNHLWKTCITILLVGTQHTQGYTINSCFICVKINICTLFSKWPTV